MPIPVVSEVTPQTASCKGGTTVIIRGSGFVHVKAVKLGDAVLTHYEVDSETQITAVAPPHAAGTVSVQVGNKEGFSEASVHLTYTQGDGKEGAAGGCCGGATGADMGHGSGTRFVIRFATQTQGLLRMKASGLIDIVVTQAGKASFSLDELCRAFTAANAPVVCSISPPSITHGAAAGITINGAYFTQGSNVNVMINGQAASNVTVVSDTQITATTPSLGMGTYTVVVGDSLGSSGNTNPCAQLKVT